MSVAAITSSAKIVNRTNNCGGNKKAGLPSLVGRQRQFADAIKTRCYPHPKAPFVISSANQIGGIGRGRSMMNQPADGVNRHRLLNMRSQCKNQFEKNAVIKPMW